MTIRIIDIIVKIDAVDNAAITPLVTVLNNVENSEENYDMSGSAFKVEVKTCQGKFALCPLFQITDLIAGVAPLQTGDTTTYSSYSGSLTTPGCMEIVNWINFIKPIKISKKQLEEFRKLKDKGNDELVDNFRPVQPLNGRPVTFYGV